MELSVDNLNEIESFGGAFLTAEEVELVLEVEGLSIEIKKEDSAAYKAYHKGRLLSLFKSRQNMVEMAANGSSPAQTAVEKLNEENEWKENT